MDQVNLRNLDFSKPLVMGILNVTPDSFSDGGDFLEVSEAVKQAKAMTSDGAAIIDIGAESSRPGSEKITAEEEIKRIIPVVDALNKELNIHLSVDTYKPEVAKACLESGAKIINDITGLQNQEMRKVVSEYDATCVIMHMQGEPKTMQEDPNYKNVIDEIMLFFEKQIELAKKDGITKIILDPGIGFGKTLEHNLLILRELAAFKKFGYPLLIGTSRKSFIQAIIGATEPKERKVGNIVSNTLALMNGADILRVHDVQDTKETIEMVKAIKSI